MIGYNPFICYYNLFQIYKNDNFLKDNIQLLTYKQTNILIEPKILFNKLKVNNYYFYYFIFYL